MEGLGEPGKVVWYWEGDMDWIFTGNSLVGTTPSLETIQVIRGSSPTAVVDTRSAVELGCVVSDAEVSRSQELVQLGAL